MVDYLNDIKIKKSKNMINLFLDNSKKMSRNEFVDYINNATKEEFNLCMTLDSVDDFPLLFEKYISFINKLIKKDENEILDALIKNGLNVFGSIFFLSEKKFLHVGCFYDKLKIIKTKGDEYKKYENFFVNSLTYHINNTSCSAVAGLLKSNKKNQNPDIDLSSNKDFLNIEKLKAHSLYFKDFHKNRDIEEVGYLLKEIKKSNLTKEDMELIYANIFDYFTYKVIFGDVKVSLLKVVDSIEEFNNKILSPNCHKIYFTDDFYIKKILINPEVKDHIKIDIKKNKYTDPLLNFMQMASCLDNTEIFVMLKNAGFKPSVKEMAFMIFKNNKADPLDITDIFFDDQDEKNNYYCEVLKYFVKNIMSDDSVFKKDGFSCDVFFEHVNFANLSLEQYTDVFDVFFKTVKSAKNDEFYSKITKSFFNNLEKSIPEELVLKMVCNDDLQGDFLHFLSMSRIVSKNFLVKLSDENKKGIFVYNSLLRLSIYNASNHSQISKENLLNLFNYGLYNENIYRNNYTNNTDSLLNDISVFMKLLDEESELSSESIDNFIHYVVNHSKKCENKLMEIGTSFNNIEIMTKIEKEIVKKNINLEGLSVKKQKRL